MYFAIFESHLYYASLALAQNINLVKKKRLSLNGCKWNLANGKSNGPKDSIMGHLLFLIDLNNLHLAIKYSEVHHFPNDTNLLILIVLQSTLANKFIMT